MALIAHQVQGSHSLVLSRPQLWSQDTTSRRAISFHLSGSTYKFVSSKYINPWSQPIILKKRKAFKVSSFKSNSQNGEAEEATGSRSRSSKKSVHLSLQQEKEDNFTESPDVTKGPVSVGSDDDEETMTGSVAIKSLFWKWLILLRNQVSRSAAVEIHPKSLEQNETVIAHSEPHRLQAGNLLRAALLRIWMFDATIKLPLLIFPPSYIVIRAVYGAEVTKELMPLWVGGPLIVASYVMLVRGVIFLYVFCYKQTLNLFINLPSCYQFVREGKPQAYLWARFVQPFLDIKNKDYKALLIQKLEQLKEWVIDKWLDYVETIWPHYCRTIRFLKRANLL